MNFYDKHVLPRMINVCCGLKDLHPYRQRACEGLVGEVLEIGFGSGTNVPFYPPSIDRVRAVDPSGTAWKLAGKRLAASSVAIEMAGLDGEKLPFDDATFDSALSTFSLCTIPNVDRALTEVRRVLKPGAQLHFLEHGLAPDEGVRKWQRRLEPAQKVIFGGCHLTRDIRNLLSDNGFTMSELDQFYDPKAPKPFAAVSLGRAAN